MKTINFSDARSNLKGVLDRVEQDADYTIITRRDAGDAVVMSLATFNSWRETLYLMSSPANARHLLDSVAELEAEGAMVRRLVEPGDELIRADAVHEPRVTYKPPSTRAPKPRSKRRG